MIGLGFRRWAALTFDVATAAPSRTEVRFALSFRDLAILDGSADFALAASILSRIKVTAAA